MFIRFRCPRCQAGLKAPESRAGDAIECPGCGQVLRIPGEKPAGLDPDATTDYVLPDDEPQPDDGAERSVESPPDLPLVKKKKKRRRGPASGAARAAPWLTGVVASLVLSLLFCGGMMGWAYFTGRPRSEGAVAALTAGRLAQEYADNPKVAAPRYETGGVPIEVSGVVRSVSADDAEDPQLVLEGAADGKPPWVRCLFDPDKGARARLRQLKVGDTIKVRGECDGRHGDYIDLGASELVP